MKKRNIIIGSSIALGLAIAGGAVIVVDYTTQVDQANQASRSNTASKQQVDTSSATYEQYSALKGDYYDRTFIANMIAHHQGAVDMAEIALENAERPEIKEMATQIIAAQEKEIADLLRWQKEWGYPSTSVENMEDHSAMAMMANMTEVTALLEDTTGRDFDKLFIEQMIIHHQGAIDMAAPAEQNAKRQQIRTVAQAVVSEQSAEIKKMEQWRREWGMED